jgi:hypothetical protein
MTTLQTTDLEKVAKMVLYEVPNHQIAAACGMSESALSQLIATDEFRQQLELTATSHFQEQEVMNQGWDSIEQLALGHLVEAMQTRPDAEFSLKVAAVANKAHRRGNLNHTPIQGNAGVRTVIQLNAQFVDKLQQNFQITDQRSAQRESRGDDRRQVNMMGISAVEKLLGRKQDDGDRLLENELADFSLA